MIRPRTARRVAEAHLRLGRMDVDVDLVERDFEEQGGDRVPVAGDEVAVGGAQGADQQPVLHRARIDEQILLVGHPAVEGRQADDAGQPQAVASAVDADAVTVELVAEQLGDPRRSIGGLERQDSPAVMIEREPDVAPRHRQPLHRVEAGGIFGARAAQELAAGGHLVEQPLDPDPRAGRKRGRPLPRPLAMIDLDSPAVGAAHAALQRQPRHAGDRGQRLAAEAEAGDPVDRVVRQLRRRMPLQREAHLVRAHPGTVVGDLDQLEPAGVKPHRDLFAPGIERVFHKFFERACRTLDHLARGDAIDELGRQPSY